MGSRLSWRFWLICVLAAPVLATVAGLAVLLWGLPSASEALQRTASPSSIILDRQGRLLYEVIDPDGGKHVPLPLAAFPPACREATIATEDAGFYRHLGIDPRAIVRAAWYNWRSGETVSGASTLTQQVARMLLLGAEERYERTMRRKIREAWLALQLERYFSKDELLALYLNQTYYGRFSYGMEAAAQSHFGKHVGELDLAECALLAGLPQSPVLYNPLESPRSAKARQAVVLDLMVQHGGLTVREAEQAKGEQLQYAATPFPIEAPHFVMYVLSELEQTLGADLLRRGGLRVHTTLDLDWQEQAESIVRRRLDQLAADPAAPPSRRVENAALVALDPRDGAIRAMLGSPDYFDAQIKGAVNGVLIHRQPGSAIKPLTYAAALDPDRAAAAGRAILTPATLISDVRTSFPTREGTPYVPLNYDLQFHGPVLLRQALASSFNVPAVKVLDHIGVDEFLRQAQALGMTTLTTAEGYGLALTLGGGEVRLLDLAAAFAAFANRGTMVRPFSIERVEWLDEGELPIDREVPFAGPEATSPQVAYLITHILSDDSARIAGFGEGSLLRLSRPAAVKTGTTSDWRDNWTVGYTPELAVGVWVGNADNEPMLGASGVDGAAPIWHDFMERALRDQALTDFSRPEGIVEVQVCAESGMLPSDHCPRHRLELFVVGTEPQNECDMHQVIRLDQRSGKLASEDTPSEQVVERVYFVLPADLQEWARQEGFPQPPRHNVGLLVTDESGVEPGGRSAVSGLQPAPCLFLPESCLVMTSPDPSARYRLRSGLPLAAQQIEVAVRPADGVQPVAVTLLIDGQPAATLAEPPYSVWWQLEPGEHEFRAEGIDVEGRELAGGPVGIAVSE